MQCDELWSFVDNKGNKQWIWLALDAESREIVGVHIGDRDESAARKLWNSLPCPQSIASVQSFTRISGMPTGQYCQLKDIEQ